MGSFEGTRREAGLWRKICMHVKAPLTLWADSGDGNVQVFVFVLAAPAR